MKASELRIGNLIEKQYHTGLLCHAESDLKKEIIVVKEISERKTSSINQGRDFIPETYYCVNNLNISFYKPIPLTEEWLVRFGFEKYENKHIESYVGNGLYRVFKGADGYWLDDGESGAINDNPILYVHQLQNIYFALTERELVYESN